MKSPTIASLCTVALLLILAASNIDRAAADSDKDKVCKCKAKKDGKDESIEKALEKITKRKQNFNDPSATKREGFYMALAESLKLCEGKKKETCKRYGSEKKNLFQSLFPEEKVKDDCVEVKLKDEGLDGEWELDICSVRPKDKDKGKVEGIEKFKYEWKEKDAKETKPEAQKKKECHCYATGNDGKRVEKPKDKVPDGDNYKALKESMKNCDNNKCKPKEDKEHRGYKDVVEKHGKTPVPDCLLETWQDGTTKLAAGGLGVKVESTKDSKFYYCGFRPEGVDRGSFDRDNTGQGFRSWEVTPPASASSATANMVVIGLAAIVVAQGQKWINEATILT